MNVSNFVSCQDYPCLDVNKSKYLVPQIDVNPKKNPDGDDLRSITKTTKRSLLPGRRIII
jgi:hypothetical protein